jgi:hypothetical protein
MKKTQIFIDCDIDCDMEGDLPFEFYIPFYKASDGNYEFGVMSNYYGCEIISENPDYGSLVLMRFYLPESLTTCVDNKWDEAATELGKLWEISMREIIAKILPFFSESQDAIYANWFIPIAPEKEILFSPIPRN